MTWAYPCRGRPVVVRVCVPLGVDVIARSGAAIKILKATTTGISHFLQKHLISLVSVQQRSWFGITKECSPIRVPIDNSWERCATSWTLVGGTRLISAVLHDYLPIRCFDHSAYGLLEVVHARALFPACARGR